MENHHFFHGKTHYFYGHGFNRKLLVITRGYEMIMYRNTLFLFGCKDSVALNHLKPFHCSSDFITSSPDGWRPQNSLVSIFSFFPEKAINCGYLLCDTHAIVSQNHTKSYHIFCHIYSHMSYIYIYILYIYIHIYICIISIPWLYHDISHCTAFPGEHPNSNGSSACARNISKPWSAWCASAELFRRRAPRRQLWPVMPTVSANQTEIWPTIGGPRPRKRETGCCHLSSFINISTWGFMEVQQEYKKPLAEMRQMSNIEASRVTSGDNPTILRSYCIINGNIIVI